MQISLKCMESPKNCGNEVFVEHLAPIENNARRLQNGGSHHSCGK